MKYFINTLKREIIILTKNIYLLLSLFITPLVFVFIVIFTFIQATVKDLPVAVLDDDNSNISREIIRSINSTVSCKIKYRVLNINEGKELIEGGKIYAFVAIPRNFKEDLNKGKQPKLVYYYNNQMILTGGNVSKDIQSALSGFRGKSALIKIDEHVKSNPFLNYSYFLSYASIAHIFQVFAALFAIWAIGIEFKKGTAKEWLNSSGNSIIIAVFSKLSVYFIVLFSLMILSYIINILLCSAPFKGNILFSIYSIAGFIFAYQFMGVLFVSILSNLRFALSVGAFYTSLGFTFAGMTFPSFAMPLFAQIYSSLLPVRPFVALIIDQALKGIPIIYDIKYLIWILIISIPGILSLPLLKKHLQDETLWYQI